MEIMPRQHRVADGDCIESIAFAYGFFPGTLWDHPENAALREKRGNPHVLTPGDVVFIPDLREKEIPGETGKLHRFRRRGVPAKLRLRLTAGDEPRADVRYSIRIDGGATVSGKSAGDGMIEHWLPPAASQAILRLETGEVYTLKLGHLRPSDDEDGVRARLVNLGYGEIVDEAALVAALLAFQRDRGLEETGEADAATMDELRSEHGS